MRQREIDLFHPSEDIGPLLDIFVDINLGTTCMPFVSDGLEMLVQTVVFVFATRALEVYQRVGASLASKHRSDRSFAIYAIFRAPKQASPCVRSIYVSDLVLHISDLVLTSRERYCAGLGGRQASTDLVDCTETSTETVSETMMKNCRQQSRRVYEPGAEEMRRGCQKEGKEEETRREAMKSISRTKRNCFPLVSRRRGMLVFWCGSSAVAPSLGCCCCLIGYVPSVLEHGRIPGEKTDADCWVALSISS